MSRVANYPEPLSNDKQLGSPRNTLQTTKISHCGTKKIIDSKSALGRGYVSSQKGNSYNLIASFLGQNT